MKFLAFNKKIRKFPKLMKFLKIQNIKVKRFSFLKKIRVFTKLMNFLYLKQIRKYPNVN